jgi:peptidoglycan/LPS O-acetylase OafA/YrhL
MRAESSRRRRIAGLVLFLVVVAAVAMVFVPMWLIRPFSPQTHGDLAVAFALRRWAPAVTALALLAGLALAVSLWRSGRWWSRALAGLALVFLGAAAWLSHVNIFEKMFSPMKDARFAAAGAAGWVGTVDPVLAVDHGGDSAAYPVRQLAYHHIVQDVVGGVPVAVTY